MGQCVHLRVTYPAGSWICVMVVAGFVCRYGAILFVRPSVGSGNRLIVMKGVKFIRDIRRILAWRPFQTREGVFIYLPVVRTKATRVWKLQNELCKWFVYFSLGALALPLWFTDGSTAIRTVSETAWRRT